MSSFQLTVLLSREASVPEFPKLSFHKLIMSSRQLIWLPVSVSADSQ